MKHPLILCVLMTVLFLGLPASTVSANPLWPGYFELLDRPYSLDVPPTGSEWHAVSSDYEPGGGGWTVVQGEFDDDDANGLVSTNDRIYGPPGEWRDVIVVDSAGRLYRVAGLNWILRPQLEIPGGPVGEIWEVISPDEEWGTTVGVEDWTDVAPPGPSVGDAVQLSGVWHEVVQISLCVEGAQGVPVRSTTWSRIKDLFRGDE